MVKLFLLITYSQIEELKKHLFYNGYHIDWETNDVITVDEEEVMYIKTILCDRGIEFLEQGER